MLYLTLALVPDEISSVTLEVRGEVVQMARGPNETWKAVDPEHQKSWHLWRHGGTLWLAEEGERTALDISAHISVTGISWPTAERIESSAPGVSLEIHRTPQEILIHRSHQPEAAIQSPSIPIATIRYVLPPQDLKTE